MILPSLSCYSQQNDSICFAYSDAKTILILANKGKQLDTLVYYYESEIETLNKIGDYKQEQIELAQQLISEQSIQIADLKAKLSESERKRANLKKVLIVFGSAILVEGIIIFVK